MPDWNTILKDYPAAVTAVAGLIGIILTFVFARLNDSRKRKFELENRRLDKRAVVYDMRIKEAREYVDTSNAILHEMNAFHSAVTDENDIFQEPITVMEKTAATLASRINEATLKMSCIEILKDRELIELNKEFTRITHPKIKSFAQILYKVVIKRTVDIKDVNIEVLAVPVEVERLITQMKYRLDELEQNIKE